MKAEVAAWAWRREVAVLRGGQVVALLQVVLVWGDRLKGLWC